MSLPHISQDLINTFLISHIKRETKAVQLNDLTKRGRENHNSVLISAMWDYAQEYTDEHNSGEEVKDAFVCGAQFVYGLLARGVEIEEMEEAEKLANNSQ